VNRYLGWLLLHVGAVAVSVGFFVHRGVRSLAGRPVPRRSVLGVLPHVVDSILLVSAVRLAAWIHQYPFVDAWLTAKVVALILYVVLGSIAVRGTRTLIVRRWAFAAALLTLVYIVHTALTHSPRLF
jgi:uncharacterized membrane protein SirB2